MSTAFLQAFTHTVGLEGDYSNHPSDSGGAARFGVTERLARAYGYTGDMRELPFTSAQAIYRVHFWEALRLDQIATEAPKVAEELFDTAVNCGPTTAVKFLQRSLNVLNRQEKDYADIEADGLVGAITIAALRSYLTRRGEEGSTILLRMLNALQGNHYVTLAERREKDEDFVYGWFRTRVVI